MRWLLFFLILFSFVNNLYGFNLEKENLLLNLEIENNFTNLFNFNFPLQGFFFSIDFNKTNFFLLGNAELRLKIKDWEISGFYQGEFLGKISESTREFIQRIIKKESFPIGKTYDLLLEIEGLEVIGGKVSKIYDFQNISLSITSKILYGRDLQRGKLFGNFMGLDEESYKFNLFLNYLYNRNYLYKRRDLVPGRGIGFSFDLDLSFNFLKNLLLKLSFKDFYGKIYWENMPFTIADATTEREYYDEYGNIVYRPLIKGYEGYENYLQNIPLKIKLLLEYWIYPFRLNLNLNYIKDLYFYHFKISYPLSSLKNFNFLTSSYYKYYMEINNEAGFILSGDKSGIYNILFYFYQVL